MTALPETFTDWLQYIGLEDFRIDAAKLTEPKHLESLEVAKANLHGRTVTARHATCVTHCSVLVSRKSQE